MRTVLFAEFINALKAERPNIGKFDPDCQANEGAGEDETICVTVGNFDVELDFNYKYVQGQEIADLWKVDLCHEDLHFKNLFANEINVILTGVMHSQNRGSVPLPTKEEFERCVEIWSKS